MLSSWGIREEAERCSANMNREYECLHGVILRHEATIGKRWHKKSREKKQNILLDAWGNDIPRIHRPDVEAMKRTHERRRRELQSTHSNVTSTLIRRHSVLFRAKSPLSCLMWLSRARKQRSEPAIFAGFTHHSGQGKHLGRAIVQSLAVREKEKTHGLQAQDQHIDQHGVEEAEAPTEPEAPIEVDARTFKTSRTLFYTPNKTNAGAPRGELPWIDFLHAMTTAGFSAFKLHGSVWQFRPVRPVRQDLPRSIQFHEPHPSAKIPFWTARRHGRRLNRAFVWTIESFVVRPLNGAAK